MISSTRGSWTPRILSWNLQAFFQVPGGHPRRVEALDNLQDLLHPGRVDPHLRGDLLHRGPEITVFVQVADDHHPDIIALLIQFGHPELPDEVGFQGDLFGIEGLEGQGLPFFVFAHGGRHEPVLQKAVPIPFFGGGFGLAIGLGLLRRRFIAIGMISQTEFVLCRRLFFLN